MNGRSAKQAHAAAVQEMQIVYMNVNSTAVKLQIHPTENSNRDECENKTNVVRCPSKTNLILLNQMQI